MKNLNALNSRNTIACSNSNEFEFLASVLATWDNTSDGIRHKRHALDQLLIRSEIDGYEKSRVNGNRDLLMWEKEGSDLAVYITRVGEGLYDVKVKTSNIIVISNGITEL